MSLKIKSILIVSITLFAGTGMAQSFGVDFNKIDWKNVCPNVAPVSVKGCNTVHPTSNLLSKKPSYYHDSQGTKYETYVPDCEWEKEQFIKYSNPVVKSGKETWSHCKLKFKSAFKSRYINHQQHKNGRQKNYFGESWETWRDRYLSDGVTNK